MADIKLLTMALKEDKKGNLMTPDSQHKHSQSSPHAHVDSWYLKSLPMQPNVPDSMNKIINK